MAKRRVHSKLDRFGKYFIVAVLVVIASVMQIRWVAQNHVGGSSFKKIRHLNKAKCTHCDGHGKVAFELDPTQLRECPICFGAGARLVVINPEFQDPCVSCLGLGRLYNSVTHQGETCYTCRGRGAVLRGHLLPPDPRESEEAPTEDETGDPNDV